MPVVSRTLATAVSARFTLGLFTLGLFTLGLFTLGLFILGGPAGEASQARDSSTIHEIHESFIVQASPGVGADALRRAVRQAGGEITHELSLVGAVAARLDAAARQELALSPDVGRLFAEGVVEAVGAETAGSGAPQSGLYTDFPLLPEADALHELGIDGRGVTVAVLDSGLWSGHADLRNSAANASRVLAQYDAISDRELADPPGAQSVVEDENGHGTHVTSLIANSRQVKTEDGRKYNGIAPGADLVIVKALDAEGRGSYADVIRGIDWIVARKDVYGIRVLNLSISAPPQSWYWDDPLNQAVMRAWQAGIVVVTAAGNLGPEPMTVGVPGNVPYVITAGALTDAYTPQEREDDYIASFSAAGPTFEAFVKPELLAPGGHVRGLVRGDAEIVAQHPEFHGKHGYFTMSGTSQATAVVSGVAALLLQAQPGLGPDEVKCRLLDSAWAALDGDGELAYSVFRHGAGLVNAPGAVASTATACANLGLDVGKDLAGVEHYLGPTRFAEDGSFYLEDVPGHSWSGEPGSTDGALAWGVGNPWVDGVGNPWVDGVGNPWVDGVGNPWVDGVGNPWVDGVPAPRIGGPWMNAFVTIDPWVGQE